MFLGALPPFSGVRRHEDPARPGLEHHQGAIALLLVLYMYICMHVYIYIYIYICTHGPFKRGGSKEHRNRRNENAQPPEGNAGP